MRTQHHEEEIGLAELRQHASDVVRRVESGEEFIVTVSGRPAARLVGFGRKTWVNGQQLAAILGDLPPWGERDQVGESLVDEVRDPWAASR